MELVALMELTELMEFTGRADRNIMTKNYKDIEVKIDYVTEVENQYTGQAKGSINLRDVVLRINTTKSK